MNSPHPENAFSLHYGNVRTPMALVVPDARWPGMWRISWPDGQLSDMANLTRIKDAAVIICGRGPPQRHNYEGTSEKIGHYPKGFCLAKRRSN
jgi:hypothetical protein